MTTIRRILLVDDDSDDSELFTEALHEVAPSVSCHISPDGISALRSLESMPMPDFIFLDVNMPKMDGWNFLEIIKNDNRLRHIPVVMYSTSVTAREQAKASSLGAIKIFSKPDSFTDLKLVLLGLIKAV